MRRLFFLSGLLGALCVPSLSLSQDSFHTGATNVAVAITESNAGTRVVDGIRSCVSVELAPAAAGPVWIVRTDGTCTTAVTGHGGIRLSRDSSDKDPPGYEFRKDDGWYGQLCGILDSGTTDVTVYVNGC